MVKKVIAAVFLIALLTVAVVQAMDKKAETEKKANETAATTEQANGLNIGSKAPDFQLKTLTGETVKLSAYKGKKVMLNFWATWCPPCKAEMPEMEQFYKQGNKDLVILAVNIDPQNDVKGFVDKNGITFPILLDTENKINSMYQILSIPTTYFIDRNGVIQNKYIGSMKQEMMKQFTEEIK